MNKLGILTKGIIKENPVLVLMLGMCPTLATTTSALNGLGMGVSTLAVLVCSNIVIAILKNIIPGKVRIPCYIVVIAGFVTIVQLLLKAYLPDLDKSLGLFIPLIVVNCIILGRAEMFASKNSVGDSALDGLGMGIGFTLALGVMGLIREFFGSGTAFNIPLYAGGEIETKGIVVLAAMVLVGLLVIFAILAFAGKANSRGGLFFMACMLILGGAFIVIVYKGVAVTPAGLFMLAPGGFFVFAILVAAVNYFSNGKAIKKKEIGCDGCAMADACGGVCDGKEADA